MESSGSIQHYRAANSNTWWSWEYLTAQFQVVSAVPLAEWYNLSGLCQGHNSEAENMLRNQDLNQLEGLGTYEIENMNMNPNHPQSK